MDVAIFGAGIAGLSAGAQPVSARHNVTMVEKRVGPGGRTATWRIQTTIVEARFDRGAPYFTARDAAFAAPVERWAEAGHAARWPAAGYGGWVGASAKNAPVKAAATGLDAQWNGRVEAISRRWFPFPDNEPEPTPGSEVSVPLKDVNEETQGIQRLTAWLGILTSIATLAVILSRR